MSECANCNKSVYVPDGYEFEEGDLCMSCTKAKADRLQALVSSADEPNGSMMWTSDHDKILARQAEEERERYHKIYSRMSECQKDRVEQANTLVRLETENDKLRGILAQGQGYYAYCGLPAADIAKYPSGLPGCAQIRMDDIVNAPETKLEVENAALFIELAALRWKLITPDNMPKIGDEVLGSQAGPHDVQAVTGYGLHYLRDHERTAQEWWDSGATHFRPINPPKEDTDGTKP